MVILSTSSKLIFLISAIFSITNLIEVGSFLDKNGPGRVEGNLNSEERNFGGGGK